MTRRRALLLCIGLLSTVAVLFVLIRPDRVPVEKIEYRNYKGDNPTRVEMRFARPSSELTAIPETPIAHEFASGQLISIHGELMTEPEEALLLVVVSFVLHTREGDVIGSQAIIGPPYDPKDIQIPVNCPTDPGRYTLLVEWGGSHKYIAQATVTVRPK